MYPKPAAQQPQLIHLSDDRMIHSGTYGKFGAQRIDKARILGLYDLHDLDRVVLPRPHAASAEDACLRTDAQLLNNAIVWDIDGHQYRQSAAKRIRFLS